MKACGAYFLKKFKKCVWLRNPVWIACEPIPWSTQGDPKIKEKTWHISEPTFLMKKCKNIRKRGPKRCPKGWGDFRGGGLGGALDGLWRPNLFLNTKSMPKVLQKWPPGCKSDYKMLQKWPPRSSNALLQERQSWFRCIKKCQLQDTRPGGLREALTIKGKSILLNFD